MGTIIEAKATPAAQSTLHSIKGRFGAEVADLALREGSELDSVDGVLDDVEACEIENALIAWQHKNQTDAQLLTSLRDFLRPSGRVDAMGNALVVEKKGG